MLSRGCGGHGGGGLDEGGGHLRGQRRGSGRSCGGHFPHQAHAAIDSDVGVALGGHVEHFQAVVVEA